MSKKITNPDDKGGRTRAYIDWDKVDKLLMAGCPGTEIAAHFGIHEDTLYRRCEQDRGMGFTVYSQQKKSTGNNMLREKQFDLAMDGSERMLIWLGKNKLGQSDVVNNNINAEGLDINIRSMSDEDLKDYIKKNLDAIK